MEQKTSEWEPLTIRLRRDVVKLIDAEAAKRDLKRVHIIREKLNEAYRPEAR